MKKLLLPMMLLSALVFTSCGGGDTAEKSDDAAKEEVQEEEVPAEPSIVGTWQCSAMDLGMEMPEEQQAMMDEMIAKTSYTFDKDGNMSMTSGMSDIPVKGTYEYADGKVTATMNGKTDAIDVAELTESKLVLSMKDRGSEIKMTFERK